MDLENKTHWVFWVRAQVSEQFRSERQVGRDRAEGRWVRREKSI